MPVTPFHFGLGLLGKGAAPAQVSFLAFVASQVVIDCETAYFMLVAREWPLHRWAHTFVVGTPGGLGAGLAVWVIGRLLKRRAREVNLASEVGLLPALIGGGLGGLTHPFLDGIMHTDIRPLRPFSQDNPFLGLVSLAHLYLLCVLAGVVGLLLLGIRFGSHE